MTMMMKQQMLTLLQTLLSYQGFVIDKSTDKDDILALIDQLKPYTTDKPLIRIGANGDGGYLVPDDLTGISTCFSPGVGAFSTFEEACANRGMEVHMADYSVEKPLIEHNRFRFVKKFIGPVTHGAFISMNDWVTSASCNDQSDLLLQMDIEGHEYLTLTSMPDELMQRFRIIVIELHYLGKPWNRDFYAMASTALHKLLKSHTCVHIHPNNFCGIEKIRGVEIPRTAEFTFLRNDRIGRKRPHTQFPHPLDYDNIQNRAIALPEIWYGQSGQA
jgi:hypothetical protein